MVTGSFKCPICNKIKSCKKESALKINTHTKTDISKEIIYKHICIDCYNKIKK